jgi:hypothetical protein|tara:strand:- start:358 stop:1224 length:867 start_codon:yes stop_codon:yes gene_type:complete
MPYIGRSLGDGVRARYIYAATSGQTTFSGNDANGIALAYSDTLYMDVYQNGVLLKPVTDYASTTGTSVVLTTGASVDDVLEMIVYDSFAVADTVSAANGGTFGGSVTITGNLSVSGTGAGTTGITSASTSGTAINIDSSNHVTMGSQPRFFCGPSSNHTMSNSTSALTQIPFDTETIDRGSNFASNTFTAPVTGDYLLHFQLRVDAVDIAATYYYFFIETSNRNYQQIMARPFSSDPAYSFFHQTVIADMDANDTATVKYQQYSGTNNHATIIGNDLRYSHFSGILLS